MPTEDGGKVVYETDFHREKPGIVGVTIPAAAGDNKSLEVGQRYQWSFSVICNPKDPSTDFYVTAYVEPIKPQPTLNNDLANPDQLS